MEEKVCIQCKLLLTKVPRFGKFNTYEFIFYEKNSNSSSERQRERETKQNATIVKSDCKHPHFISTKHIPDSSQGSVYWQFPEPFLGG